MRLIDADALAYERITRSGDDEVVEVIPKDDIDAVPTICCERCEHDQYCYRTLEWHILEGRRDKHYPSACDLFQPQWRPNMTDLAHIEALVGPLPKGREYARLTIGDKTIDWNDKADAALAEAYAVIERQARMLRLALDDLSGSVLGPMSDADRDAILADLARRAEEEKHHD